MTTKIKKNDAVERGIKTRKKIKTFITKYHARNGCAPSLQEIAAGVGLTSHNAVRMQLLTLKANGEVSWIEGKQRTVRVLEA